MDGAVRLRWMAQWRLNSDVYLWTERRQLESSRRIDSDGRLLDDGAARRQWMAQRQWTARRLVDGDGWRDGILMAMYGEGQR